MNTSIPLFFNDAWKNLVKTGCEGFGLSLDDQQLDLISAHAANLHMWNRTINLTSIIEPAEIAAKHFIDSLAIMPYIKHKARILDIGSGGGFPGFCLKIANPDLDVVMIDSAKKKVNFLKDLIRSTNLKNIEAIHIRAEELADNAFYQNSFDIVVSRAFAKLDKFVKLSKPFLNKNGVILAMKGKDVLEEIDEINGNHISLKSFSYILPFQNIQRSIIKICYG